jgi:uncharacterized protein YoxC
VTWWQWLLVAASVIVLGVTVGCFFEVRSLRKTVQDLTDDMTALKMQTLPLLVETRTALRDASGANRKADALLDTAASLTETADAASKLAYAAVTNPVVKVMAWFTGGRRAIARLTKPAEARTPTPDTVNTPRTPPPRKRRSKQ